MTTRRISDDNSGEKPQVSGVGKAERLIPMTRGSKDSVNRVERLIRGVDRWQQRHVVPAFTFGVIKKYGDDNAGQLVASLSHSAFVSLFPLLLVLTTILGIIA